MHLSAFHHVALIVSDYARSKDFYTRILGLPVIAETHRAERASYKLDLAVGEGRIELFSFPDPPPRPTNPEAQGLRHLAFAVPDAAAVRGELLAQGVLVEEIRADPVTGARFFFAKDPDDLPLEFYEVDNNKKESTVAPR